MKADVHAEPVHEGDNLVPRVEDVPLSRLVAYFLRLGTVGFGGPIALVGYMQRDLAGRQALGVDRRLFAGAGLFSTQPRASSRTAHKLSRVDTQWNARRKAGWYCVRLAFSSDDPGTGGNVLAFWTACVDSRNVLRNWRGCKRHHRAQRLAAHPKDP